MYMCEALYVHELMKILEKVFYKYIHTLYIAKNLAICMLHFDKIILLLITYLLSCHSLLVGLIDYFFLLSDWLFVYLLP